MIAPGIFNSTEKVKEECSEMQQNALISYGNQVVTQETPTDVHFYYTNIYTSRDHNKEYIL